MSYTPTIGLEIHVELNTRTKMFCGCLNDADEKEPNKNTCSICLAHPGTLPTANKKSIESVIKLGLALEGKVAESSHFDRKSYFYPDLPKGYQISQYEKPLITGGTLNGIKITRIHLEEDTGKLLHAKDNKSSLVDFNRAGVPLMELVTEPEIKSGEEAANFAKELQLILRYLKIANADMEKGQMRIEANISLSPEPVEGKQKKLGTKVEIKNLNSFKIVQQATNYEIKRQKELLESGKKITQETRGWDEKNQSTKSQRTKETAHDYRYFPEPDLPPLDLTKSDFMNIENLKAEIPELPAQKRSRLAEEYNLTPEQAILLSENPSAAQYFEESVSEIKTEILSPSLRGAKATKQSQNINKLLFNYLTSDIFGLMAELAIDFKDLKITPENFADLVALVQKGELSSRMAKDLIVEMQKTGADPRTIIIEKDISQVSDENTIKEAIEEVIKENEEAVEDYKKGKETALKFLIGKTMEKLKGQGNPKIMKNLWKTKLTS